MGYLITGVIIVILIIEGCIFVVMDANYQVEIAELECDKKLLTNSRSEVNYQLCRERLNVCERHSTVATSTKP